MRVKFPKQVNWKLTPMILMAAVVLLLLIACRFLEPRAPQRSFTPEELLIDPDALAPIWEEAWGPFFPTGDDLCTTECAAIQFGVTDTGPSKQAEHDVYRYLSAGIARRTFEKVYLEKVAYLDSVNQWTYQSPVTGQSHFGCYEWEGPAGSVCEWAGRYEEYIVVFWVRMIPGEMSLKDMEQVVKAIDARMAQYLGTILFK